MAKVVKVCKEIEDCNLQFAREKYNSVGIQNIWSGGEVCKNLLSLIEDAINSGTSNLEIEISLEDDEESEIEQYSDGVEEYLFGDDDNQSSSQVFSQEWPHEAKIKKVSFTLEESSHIFY